MDDLDFSKPAILLGFEFTGVNAELQCARVNMVVLQPRKDGGYVQGMRDPVIVHVALLHQIRDAIPQLLMVMEQRGATKSNFHESGTFQLSPEEIPTDDLPRVHWNGLGASDCDASLGAATLSITVDHLRRPTPAPLTAESQYLAPYEVLAGFLRLLPEVIAAVEGAGKAKH